MQNEEVIRLLSTTDSMEELTALLHAAYFVHGSVGLNFTAVDQSVETTFQRASEGECWVIDEAGKLVATAILRWPNMDEREFLDHGPRDLMIINQLAVHPTQHRRGYGDQMLEHLCHRARALGAIKVALDTAKPAEWLVKWYEKRGFRVVGSVQWSDKTYESHIMLRDL